MYDLLNELAAGEEGVVTGVDGIGTIHIQWNNGSTLALVPMVDEFEILGSEN